VLRAAECSDGLLRRQQLVTAIEHAAGKSAVKLPITPRELQVLRHIGYGLSNEEIARSLGISVETVKEHVQNLLRKLKVHDRTAAAVLAVRAGLV
jgi:DNA-binding NarL/FixJ family response regulator